MLKYEMCMFTRRFTSILIVLILSLRVTGMGICGKVLRKQCKAGLLVLDMTPAYHCISNKNKTFMMVKKTETHRKVPRTQRSELLFPAQA